MSAQYVDVHCHIQFEQYAADDTELIRRMQMEGVTGIVVGVDLESSKKAVTLAEKHAHLYASVGLHPNRVSEEIFDEQAFREMAQHPKTVAIGECGLDYFRPTEVNEEIKEKQKGILRQQALLAVELNKALIIHARPSKGTVDAYLDLIQLLTEIKKTHLSLRGDVHFFVGGVEEARSLIELGFTVSFTAVVTFARDYDGVVRALPLESILSETDAPYIAPESRRGQRNDPLAVIEVVQKIAEIRDEPVETVATALFENARRMFDLP